MNIETGPLHSLVFAEFFAGIGLMRMGLEQQGWRISYANDIDPVKEKIYRNHFRDVTNHFVLEDIHRIAGDGIPAVHLATASFPCTDLSLAGRRDGLAGKQSSAFWGFIRVLAEMKGRRPPLILLENVEGFLSSHNGEDFRQALLAINELGYSVDAFIIDAARFVPQSRVRLFIVGRKRTGLEVKEKQLMVYQSELRPAKLAAFIFQHPEIDWDIRDLPALPRRSTTLADIVKELSDDSEEWWNEERTTYLLAQTFDRHRVLLESARNQSKLTYFTAFRRMRNGRSMAEIRSDGIAGCLRTAKGGSARQILIQAGFGQIKVRLLSPAECAKLMGAEGYKIGGSINEALFGFGDAVCVPVVSWIAANYLNPVIENELTPSYGYQSSALGI